VELLPTDKTPFVSESDPVVPVRLVTDRAAALARLGAGFAELTDDELLVAQLWLLGHSLGEACVTLEKETRAVRKLWASMRRKVRAVLLAGVATAVPA
jgi:hypothetical protein